MKIGIVSRIHGINYGANLQALALQRTLESLGSESEYIDFEVEVHPKGFRKILNVANNFVRDFLGYRKRLFKTLAFKSRNIKLSQECKTIDEVESLSNSYDCLMTGSDQIWNPRYYGTSQGLYLLEFNSSKPKISYASSFGVSNLPESIKDKYKESFGKFDRLSVREEIGKRILHDLGIEREIREDIDPTLLLTEEEWKDYFPEEPVVKKRYLLCYVMPGADNLNKYILSLAKNLKTENKVQEVIVLGDKEYKGLLSNFKFVRTADPSDFLNYVYNADYILTSSFHGTCFSIIFNKKFLSVLDPQNKFNSRIENLLERAQLSNQILYKGKENAVDFNIDYKNVNQLLKSLREDSKEYLSSIINDLRNKNL